MALIPPELLGAMATLRRLAATQHVYATVTARDMTSLPAEWAVWLDDQADAIERGELPGWLAGAFTRTHEEIH